MSSEPREWLIRKGGYYYRPNCSGYTTSKFEAGRYTKAEAEAEASVEPWHMSAIHQDDVEDDPVSSRVRMDTARIDALEAEIARLKEEAKAERLVLKALLDGARSENARLRDALAPFAALAHAEYDDVPNAVGVTLTYDNGEELGAVPFGCFRTARRAREGGKADG